MPQDHRALVVVICVFVVANAPRPAHADELPLHVFGLSHAESLVLPHDVPPGSNTSTQVELVPLQWSAASLSHSAP